MTNPAGPLPPAPHVEEAVRVEPLFNHGLWERLHEDQMGVDARDKDGHNPGMAGVRREILSIDVGAWDPVDGYKHVLVGTVDKFQFYNPWSSGDEADFNIMVIPDAPFKFILDDVVAKMSPGEKGELHTSRDGQHKMVECEVTPDEKYYSNDWFPTQSGRRSPLVDGRIGVYGTWVRDWGHGGRPEIHPAEVIWWRRGRFNSYDWRIIVLQDDSNRFDRPSDYVASVSRPWSAYPRRVRITMALQATRGQNTPYYIRIVDSNRMYHFPDEGAPLVTVNYQGDPTLSVAKVTPDTSRLKVRLSNLFPDPADQNALRCFMYIEIQVGEGDRGEEGFVELWVSKNELPLDRHPGDIPPNPPPPPGAPPRDPDGRGPREP